MNIKIIVVFYPMKEPVLISIKKKIFNWFSNRYKTYLIPGEFALRTDSFISPELVILLTNYRTYQYGEFDLFSDFVREFSADNFEISYNVKTISFTFVEKENK